jgi:hypothetical protein
LIVDESAEASRAEGLDPIFWSTVHTVHAAPCGPRCILQR